MCWRYTLTLPLSLVFPSSVSPIYFSLHVSQITTYMRLELSHVKRVFQFKSNLNVFKGLVLIYQEIVAAFTSFITTFKDTR